MSNARLHSVPMSSVHDESPADNRSAVIVSYRPTLGSFEIGVNDEAEGEAVDFDLLCEGVYVNFDHYRLGRLFGLRAMSPPADRNGWCRVVDAFVGPTVARMRLAAVREHEELTDRPVAVPRGELDALRFTWRQFHVVLRQRLLLEPLAEVMPSTAFAPDWSSLDSAVVMGRPPTPRDQCRREGHLGIPVGLADFWGIRPTVILQGDEAVMRGAAGTVSVVATPTRDETTSLELELVEPAIARIALHRDGDTLKGSFEPEAVIPRERLMLGRPPGFRDVVGVVRQDVKNAVRHSESRTAEHRREGSRRAAPRWGKDA
jgi:hypothetical protein